MTGHRIQSSFDAVSIAGSGSLLGGTSAHNTRARTDVDDIHDLIEDALALSAKARSVVEGIVGGGFGETGCANGKDCPTGILTRIGERSRDARTQIAIAAEEIERLARSFGV